MNFRSVNLVRLLFRRHTVKLFNETNFKMLLDFDVAFAITSSCDAHIGNLVFCLYRFNFLLKQLNEIRHFEGWEDPAYYFLLLNKRSLSNQPSVVLKEQR